MRSLIFGATGLVGSHLTAACDDRGFARLGTGYRTPHPDHHPVDLRDADAVNELVADYEPDVTFLAAGLTDAGYAEQFPGECRAVTVGGAKNVAAAVARHGGTVVLISSDEVFGESRTARREDDPVAPFGVFAACKAEAEAVVRRTLPGRHLIARTSWVFGAEARGRSLAATIRRKLDDGEPFEAATDLHGHPTYAGDLADVAVELARIGHTGTIHVVGPERHTEFTFARLVAHVHGYDTDLIVGRTADAIGGIVRPRGVWLDRFRLRTLLGAKAVRTPAAGLRAMRSGVGMVALRAA